jgi:hypothetical protein
MKWLRVVFLLLGMTLEPVSTIQSALEVSEMEIFVITSIPQLSAAKTPGQPFAFAQPAQALLSADPRVHAIQALSWRNWQVVMNTVALLQIPLSSFRCGRALCSKDTYALFVSKVLTVALAVQANFSMVVLLEDSVRWPITLREQLAPLPAMVAEFERAERSGSTTSAFVARLGDTGTRGLALSRRACQQLLHLVYTVGANDRIGAWLLRHFAPVHTFRLQPDDTRLGTRASHLGVVGGQAVTDLPDRERPTIAHVYRRRFLYSLAARQANFQRLLGLLGLSGGAGGTHPQGCLSPHMTQSASKSSNDSTSLIHNHRAFCLFSEPPNGSHNLTQVAENLVNHMAFSQMHPDHVSVFYHLVPVASPHHSTRQQNVRAGQVRDPRQDPRGVFHSLYWKDWSTVLAFFALAELRVDRIISIQSYQRKYRYSARGKYALFASKLLACAYAVQFRLPNIVLLEDDVEWKQSFRKNVNVLARLAGIDVRLLMHVYHPIRTDRSGLSAKMQKSQT